MPLILSGTSGLSGVDGSVSTPALQGSDTNTGVYFPAADTVAIAAGGTEAFRATSGGNLSLTGTMAMGSSFLRNRIINGAMVIDQRNAGAAQNSIADFTYTVDRWVFQGAASKFNFKQNLNFVTPPAGFTKYLGCSVASAVVPAAGDYFRINQRIEGSNVADLGFGSANAQTVTLSFWVRSSLTGTFGGSVMNSAANRSYPFPYTISSANTWEFKTVTIPGDTTGIWLTDTGIGLVVSFALGAGSSFTATASTWGATGAIAPTSSKYVADTLSATFYITGVQLEAGSVATPFERRQYGQELALCQRYYFSSAQPITSAPSVGSICGHAYTTSGINARITSPSVMRTTPTLAIYNNSTANQMRRTDNGTTVSVTVSGTSNWGQIGFGYIAMTGTPFVATAPYDFDYALNAEL